MLKRKQAKNFRGLSIIELLVAVFIFTIIIVAATSTFTNTFSTWKKTRQTQADLEKARTAMETIGKSIRMSNQLKYSSNTLSMFNNSQNKCIRYSSGAGGSLVSTTCTPTEANIEATTYDCELDNCGGDNYGNQVTLVSSDVVLTFNVEETDVAGHEMGKATMSILVGTGAQQRRIQTTVSFRDYKEFFYVTP
jgi:Tfp pilus assembly protein PilV